MHLSSSSRAWKRWLVLTWSLTEVMLFGGLVLGWGSLVFVLKDEGIYANLCQNDIHVNNLSAASIVSSDFNKTSRTNIEHSSSTSAMVVNISTARPTIAKFRTEVSHACSLQDERFALCFAIASALNLFSSAIMGQINCKFGTRMTRIVAFVFFTAGALMLAFTSVDVPWLIFPGLSMIAIGGLPLMITDVQASLLFTKGRGTIAAGLCGVFDMSAGVQLIVKLAYESGFSRQTMFLVIAGVHCLTLVSTFGFLPKMFFDDELLGVTDDTEQDANETVTSIAYESGFSRQTMFLVIAGVHCLTLVSTFGFLPKMFFDDELLGVTDDTEQDANETVTSIGTPSTEDKQTVDTEDLTVALGKGNSISHLKCLKQPKFITQCIWFCLLQLKFYYFLGSMNTYLNRIFRDDKNEVSYFTNVGLYIMMGGVFTSCFAGMTYDWQRKRCQGRTELSQKAMPAVPPLAIGSILCLLFSVMTIFKSEAVIYPVFICMTVFRSFLYGTTFVFVSAVFPSEYFGFLMGIVNTVGGAVSLLQYALFSWAEAYNNAPVHVDLLLLVLVLISFCHPFYIWFMCNREKRKIAENGLCNNKELSAE